LFTCKTSGKTTQITHTKDPKQFAAHERLAFFPSEAEVQPHKFECLRLRFIKKKKQEKKHLAVGKPPSENLEK